MIPNSKKDLKLRLLLFEDCNRNCPGCCNKDWNLDCLPIEDNFSDYKGIILTGGEPLLNPELVVDTIKKIKKVNDCPIYVYTAKIDNLIDLAYVLRECDGLTVTLHDQKDLNYFYKLHLLSRLCYDFFENKSLRLNVFEDVDLKSAGLDLKLWEVKDNMKWIKHRPLPEDEVFCRLK